MVRRKSDGESMRAIGWKAVLFVLTFGVIGFAACTLPDSPDAFHPGLLRRLPLEVPLVALALLLLPRRLAMACAVLAAILVFGLLFLKFADIGVLAAFQRRFDPYLDMKMLVDGWNILSGAVGTVGAALAIGLAVAALAMLVGIFFGPAWR